MDWMQDYFSDLFGSQKPKTPGMAPAMPSPAKPAAAPFSPMPKPAAPPPMPKIGGGLTPLQAEPAMGEGPAQPGAPGTGTQVLPGVSAPVAPLGGVAGDGSVNDQMKHVTPPMPTPNPNAPGLGAFGGPQGPIKGNPELHQGVWPGAPQDGETLAQIGQVVKAKKNNPNASVAELVEILNKPKTPAPAAPAPVAKPAPAPARNPAPTPAPGGGGDGEGGVLGMLKRFLSGGGPAASSAVLGGLMPGAPGGSGVAMRAGGGTPPAVPPAAAPAANAPGIMKRMATGEGPLLQRAFPENQFLKTAGPILGDIAAGMKGAGTKRSPIAAVAQGFGGAYDARRTREQEAEDKKLKAEDRAYETEKRGWEREDRPLERAGKAADIMGKLSPKAANVMEGILQKVERGEELTPGQQKIFNIYEQSKIKKPKAGADSVFEEEAPATTPAPAAPTQKPAAPTDIKPPADTGVPVAQRDPNIKTVQSAAEAAALKPGTKFYDPNGVLREVP